MRVLATLCAAALAMSITANAFADVLYGGAGNGATLPGSLFTVSQTDGSTTLIGDPVTPGGISGLTFATGGTLFGSTVNATASTLVTINPVTGTLLSTVGPITLAGNPIVVGDLATQPGTGTLFGILPRISSSAGSIVTINPTTAVATLVGNTTTGNGGGLAFAPDGTLYLTGFTATPGSFALHVLNPANAAILSSVPLDGFYDGLGIRSDGVLFATPGGEGAAAAKVYTINPTTGVSTLLGSTTTQLSDLAFAAAVPEPTTAALMAVGGIVCVAWRRRRAG